MRLARLASAAAVTLIAMAAATAVNATLPDPAAMAQETALLVGAVVGMAAWIVFVGIDPGA